MVTRRGKLAGLGRQVVGAVVVLSAFDACGLGCAVVSVATATVAAGRLLRLALPHVLRRSLDICHGCLFDTDCSGLVEMSNQNSMFSHVVGMGLTFAMAGLIVTKLGGERYGT